MKLVTLNLWGGRMKETFNEFFENYKDVGIWCFQEVYKEFYTAPEEDQIDRSEVDFSLFDNLKKYLDLHLGDFCQVLKGVYGIATFIHKDIRIIEKGEILIAKGDYEDVSDLHNRDHHRKLLWMEIEIKGKKLLIANAHFTHRPEGKGDHDKRLNQSKIIVDFLKMFDCPKILAGDFNLLPDTQSIKMIEYSGMRNLVKEYGITSTRTDVYKKPLKFADYVFVSSDIEVKDFKVLPDVVSDHYPLMLDFDL
jgi:endonuclease/exonuclease/phosphatase family metal-dependent hydrolase